MIVGEILRLAVEYVAAHTGIMLTVHTYQLTTGPVTDTEVLESIGGWVENVWHGSWSDLASNEVTIDGWQAEILNTDGTVNRFIGLDTGLVLAGDVIGDPDPAAVSAFMQASTAVPKTRGRKYIPGVADPRIENGVLNATTLSQLAALALVYVAERSVSAGAGILTAGVLSRTLQQFVPFQGSVVVTNVPAYQRRRKPNVGS